jgi:hypothetical protein
MVTIQAMAFERVYTIWGYWDGPRTGLADYRGRAHHYQCEWSHAEDDYGDVFALTPVDHETLALAMEQWSIWREWELAFHRGEVPQSTHPGMEGTHPRYSDLEARIQAALSAKHVQSLRAVASFRVRPGEPNPPPGVMRELEVEWTDAEQ